jgi:hypothetical protein
VLWSQDAQITGPVGADAGVARAVLAGDRLAVIAQDPDVQDTTLRVWRRTGTGWEEEVVDPDLVAPARPAMAPYAALTFSADGDYLAAGTREGLKVYSLLGPGAAPRSQPADTPTDPDTVVGAAFPTATADAVRAIDTSGSVVDWQLSDSGQWEPRRGPQLLPGTQVQMDTDGGRALLGDGNSFTIADTITGSRLVGPLAVSRGSTSRGRSVVEHAGAVDEQASPQAPWSRGMASGTVDVALSPDGQRLARLVAPTGNVGISLPGASEAAQPMCADTVAAAQIADRTNEDVLTLAVADNGVVVSTVDVPASAQGPVDPDAGPASSWCLLPTDSSPVPQPSLVGERFGPVRVGADGQRFVVGTELNGVGTVDVYPVDTGLLETTQSMNGGVTAVALTSDDAPLVAAGDQQGNLLAFQVGSADAASGFGSEIRCDVPLPVAEAVAAVSVGRGSDGEYLVAAATRKEVFVYRISVAADPCATLIGGFDLLRDEGEVIDLALDENGLLTALESDLNVFTFDPLAPLTDVAGTVTQLSDDRGWTLTQDDCQILLGTPRCPT